MSIRQQLAWLILGPGLLLVSTARLRGQETPAAPPPDAAAAAPGSVPLAQAQQQLAEKYRRLEDLLFKMADFEATSNPRRAALLRQAYKQSKDRLTQAQLNTVVDLLEKRQYKRAIDGQETARVDLQDLLQLLLSEDRADRVKTETQRLQESIKELKRLERLQRGVRGQTESAADPRGLADKQGALADRTGDLAEQLEAAEPARQGEPPAAADREDPAGAEPQAGEPQDRDEPAPAANEPPAAEPGAEPSDAAPQPSDAAPASPPGATPPEAPTPDLPAESAEPSPGQGNASPPPPAGSQPPAAQQRVREAEQRMREAQQRLAEAQKSESLEKQNAALEQLQEAIAELEEVLRQLREEEKERVLTLLESRFRQMLEQQLRVYEATQRLDAIPEAERGRDLDIQANKLAFEQRKIAGQADRCLTLLREEGSSVAFPEVVEQIRNDMESVSDRLAESKVGTLTQSLQQEIIASLEEMIAAFQQAQQDQDQPPPGQPGEAGEDGAPPLVDALAELKMIRSLQLRVNVRTQRYAKLLDNADDPVGQATTDELRQVLTELGQRQARIQQVTRDIVLGKNR